MIAIRLPSSTSFPSLRVTLDDVEYVLSLAWNSREGFWYLSLADAGEELIAAGVKVVADFPLLLNARHDARCPPGSLIAFDTSGQSLPPHYEDMAGETPRVLLLYTPEAEL